MAPTLNGVKVVDKLGIPALRKKQNEIRNKRNKIKKNRRIDFKR